MIDDTMLPDAYSMSIWGALRRALSDLVVVTYVARADDFGKCLRPLLFGAH
jgi:hypothetical protein